MAVPLDFSCLLSRLDKHINELVADEPPLFPNNPPLLREADCTLRDCLQEMSSRGLRTCLVRYSPDTHSWQSLKRRGVAQSDATSVAKPSDESSEELNAWAHQMYQFLDMRDVLCLVLEEYRKVYGPLGEQSDRPANVFLEELVEKEVGVIANMSGRNSFVAAYDSSTLRELLQKLEDSPRVPVFTFHDAEPILVGIYSVIDLFLLLNTLANQSRCIGAFDSGLTPFAKPHVAAIESCTAGMVKTKTARERKFSDLHICYEDESLLEAMKVLHQTGFSAVPIVSRANPRNCMGIFSVRDVQPIILQATNFTVTGALLSIPILDYINAVRRMQSLKARYPVIQVRENATLDTVIGKILAANVRRLLLTDESGLLSGILSVTDLGRFVAKELTKTA